MRDETQPSTASMALRPATGRETRRHDRFPVTLPATLTAGKTITKSTVSDVSFGGLYFRTGAPPPLRNLVRIKLTLPSDGCPIELLGMAVYVARPGTPGAQVPGVGIQFFGIDEATRERWEKYIHRVRSEAAAPVAPVAPAPRAPSVRPAIVPELRLNAPSVAALHAAIFGPVDGTLRVRSQIALAAGSPMRIVLVHPSSTRQLAIAATVLKTEGEHLYVRLADRDARRDEIEAFLRDQEHITMDLDITVDDLAI